MSDRDTEVDPADDKPTRVALFVTCVGEFVDPDVPVAAVRVLRASGCEVTVPENQTCCGQPAWNSGFTQQAAAVARASLDSLAAALEADPECTVVVPAGSCATMIRKYWPQLFELAGDPDDADRARTVGARTREFTEFIADRDLPAMEAEPCSVAIHQSCHLLRELRVDEAPGAAIGRVAGCAVQEWPHAETCCGFGGTFSVRLPEVSVAMADAKLDSLPVGTEVVVSADASCLMHLETRAAQRGMPVRTQHVAEVLADGLARSRPDGGGDG